MVEQNPTGRGPVSSNQPIRPVSGGPETGSPQSDTQRQFLQISVAIAIALFAVVAGQVFFLARDVKLLAQDLVNMGTRLERVHADFTKNQTIFNEVPVLRAQVGEIKRLLQGGEAAAGVPPEGPPGWTGVQVNDLGQLLPYLARLQGDLGEAWIYSNNDNFLTGLAQTLQSIEAGEQPQ